MSSIVMKSEDVIIKCELVIDYINKLRLYYREKAIHNYVERKNGGMIGWFRRIFNKQYTKEMAKEELDINYNANNLYWNSRRYYSDEENIARSLIRIANKSGEVFVSSKEFDNLEHILNVATVLLKLKILYY